MKETQTEKVVRKGRDHYNSTVLWAKRNKRRIEAENRQAESDSLTLKEKLDKARTRPGESKREVARLTKLLAAQTPPQVKQTPLTETQRSAKVLKQSKDAASLSPIMDGGDLAGVPVTNLDSPKAKKKTAKKKSVKSE